MWPIFDLDSILVNLGVVQKLVARSFLPITTIEDCSYVKVVLKGQKVSNDSIRSVWESLSQTFVYQTKYACVSPSFHRVIFAKRCPSPYLTHS